MRDIVLIIHNVRSAANVGALFRTADGSGVKEIWLSGYTPSPARREGGMMTVAEKSLAKTALGAERIVSWTRKQSLGLALRMLQKDGYRIVALEQDERSVALADLVGDESLALIVGNEVRGVDRRILQHCDTVVEIPMHGWKHSLNVSVACGVALYALQGIMKR